MGQGNDALWSGKFTGMTPDGGDTAAGGAGSAQDGSGTAQGDWGAQDGSGTAQGAGSAQDGSGTAQGDWGAQEPPKGATAAQSALDVPEIDTATPYREAAMDEVRQFLAARHRVFSHAGRTVFIDQIHVLRLDYTTGVSHDTLECRIREINANTGGGILERSAVWFKVAGKTKTKVRVPVPDWAAKSIPEPHRIFRPLHGILQHAAIDADNRMIHGRTGYDPAHGAFVWSDIPQGYHPDLFQSPQEAWSFLRKQWLGEAAFATEGDAARAVMSALTILKARLSLFAKGKYPGFIFNSSVPASGKSILIEAIGLAAAGVPPALLDFPKEAEELNKVLTAATLEDPPAVSFDNVPNGWTIRSPVLDRFITAPRFTSRILGRTKVAEFSTMAVVFANGNNIDVAEDTRTRFLVVRLVPKGEAAHNKKYQHDLRTRTMQLRGMILAALHCIARTPVDPVAVKLEPVGRFPAWWHEVALPVMLASGETGALDEWDAGAVTIRNVEALGEFLEALASVQKARDVPSLRPMEIIRYLLPEYGLLVDLKPEVEKAARMRPDAAGQDLLDIERAQKALAKQVSVLLRRWNDVPVNGLRMEIRKEKDENYRPCTMISAAPVTD